MAIIIGIDPGSRLCGWGIVSQRSKQIEHVDNGVITLTHQDSLPSRLAELHRRLAELIATYQPSAAAIENVFQHRNPHSALVLGQARGAALACLAIADLPVNSYSATEVKKIVAGHGRASKEQMQIMISKHLALKEAPQEDASDATSIALCHALRLSLNLPHFDVKKSKKKYSKKRSDALLLALANKGAQRR